MVGLLLVAGVALLLTSVKGSAAPSESESTAPENALKRTRPGFLGPKVTSSPLPPTGRRSLGTQEVTDTRYDAKGGLPALAVVAKKGLREADAVPPKSPARAVRPGHSVAVMPPARYRTRVPSRFRVPTFPSTKGR